MREAVSLCAPSPCGERSGSSETGTVEKKVQSSVSTQQRDESKSSKTGRNGGICRDQDTQSEKGKLQHGM